MKNIKIEKPKNDIIYVRVSSKDQVDNFSLGNQEKFCKEFCKREEHNVIALFIEKGESAKSEDRTEFQKMLRFCEKNKKQVRRVVIHKVDRFFRNAGEHLAFRAFLRKLGIALVSATEHFDDSPGGKLYETMLAAHAQFDNEVRGQRSTDGMKTRAMKGLWIGIAPWGYKNTGDATPNKIMIQDSKKAPAVKIIFEKYLTGKYSFTELADIPNKMGIKTTRGRKADKQFILRIIRNPIYCGRIVIPKWDIEVMGLHEPIISEEMFDKAQLSKRVLSLGRKSPKKDNQEFPLRGIQCGYCGKNMTGGPTKGRTKLYNYYNCYNKKCLERKSIAKNKLENDFTKFLEELTPNGDWFDILKEAIKIAYKSELGSVVTLERNIALKIQNLENEKTDLIKLRVKGDIPQNDYMQLSQQYGFQITELKKELSELSTPELGLEKIIDSGVEFLKQLPKAWKDLYVKDFRVLRSLLFPKNLVYTYPYIKTLELCCIYNIKPEFICDKNLRVDYASVSWNSLIIELKAWSELQKEFNAFAIT